MIVFCYRFCRYDNKADLRKCLESLVYMNFNLHPNYLPVFSTTNMLALAYKIIIIAKEIKIKFPVMCPNRTIKRKKAFCRHMMSLSIKRVLKLGTEIVS